MLHHVLLVPRLECAVAKLTLGQGRADVCADIATMEIWGVTSVWTHPWDIINHPPNKRSDDELRAGAAYGACGEGPDAGRTEHIMAAR